MEKDIGKIKKNETADIIVRIDEYKGKKGLTIREYITSEKYTGFSKSGTRIPAEEFLNFRDMINSVNLDELTSSEKEVKKDEADNNKEIEGKLKPEETEGVLGEEKPKKTKKPKKDKIEEIEEQEIQKQDIVDEAEKEAEVKEESKEDEECEEKSEEAE